MVQAEVFLKGPYQEEWKEPPLDRAGRYIERKKFYEKLNSSVVRMVILRCKPRHGQTCHLEHEDPLITLAPVMLFPLAFIPFLPTIVMAAIRSLTLGEHLQEPFFQAKGMSPLQQATFVSERQIEFRGNFKSFLAEHFESRI